MGWYVDLRFLSNFTTVTLVHFIRKNVKTTKPKRKQKNGSKPNHETNEKAAKRV